MSARGVSINNKFQQKGCVGRRCSDSRARGTRVSYLMYAPVYILPIWFMAGLSPGTRLNTLRRAPFVRIWQVRSPINGDALRGYRASQIPLVTQVQWPAAWERLWARCRMQPLPNPHACPIDRLQS